MTWCELILTPRVGRCMAPHLVAIANRIAEDAIHVLINLNGYTKGGRTEIFAM